MRTSHFNAKAILKAAVLVTTILLFGASASFAQQVVNLTAAPTSTVLPDGNTVPMWGYFCGAAVTTNTVPAAACAALNPGSAATLTTPATWSPVVITVPTGQALTINLTNNLSFLPTTGSTTANSIPTSIVIVGQVGGGLGMPPTTTPSPDHSLVQGCVSWFIASGATPPGTPCPAAQAGASGEPPVQGPRVQSMATEVATGTTARTDGWPAYPGAPGVRHQPQVIGKMAAHVVLPWVHRIFSNLKVWALGVYHGLRRRHLQSYLDEFVFRFNRRRTRHAAFRSLLGIAADHPPLTYQMLISPEAKA